MMWRGTRGIHKLMVQREGVSKVEGGGEWHGVGKGRQGGEDPPAHLAVSRAPWLKIYLIKIGTCIYVCIYREI